MIVTWDRTDDMIWFGIWKDSEEATPLYLIAERLPKSNEWDWAVWQSNKPVILKRGIAPSALKATAFAEGAASRWRDVGQVVPGE